MCVCGAESSQTSQGLKIGQKGEKIGEIPESWPRSLALKAELWALAETWALCTMHRTLRRALASLN